MAEARELLSLPLVSVVIDNYNLGRYLKDAADSVFAQTYPNIECIIVDDASTDDSTRVLDEIAAARSSVKVIRRQINGDQIAACLDGLAASRGDYIVFLDADDVLLKHCIATHVFVHLSLRIPVGFTCSDMLQIVSGNIVLGGNSVMSRYILGAKPPKAPARTAANSATDGLMQYVDPSVLDRIYKVDMKCRAWPWTATSGFFFRRDALNLWANAPGLAELRRSTDGFFGLAINAITGSVLIDESLAGLRIHATNNFTRHPQLNNIRNYDIATSEREVRYRHIILEEITRDPGRFRFHHTGLLKRSLFAADTRETSDTAPAWARKSRLSHLFVTRYASLASVVGESKIACWMFEKGVPARVMKEAGIRYAFADRIKGTLARAWRYTRRDGN
ncbi:glycosyl transferase family 2 [Methylovirgula ligni]|uniref:Glycosyl transferase family 2 n=1 Tax=Methylovirgula ligni TaxID=569860 RepID=A0A3D9YX41_9HYPH|nr:glycosyltransferase family A protein [Methylovirgula ligni]REF86261.1 glycosyl transferase family 2 [Methylovirgula ligni]